MIKDNGNKEYERYVYRIGTNGSSFISRHPGCNAVDVNGIHTGHEKHYSNLVFTATTMLNGSLATLTSDGNGAARIQRIDSINCNILTCLCRNSVWYANIFLLISTGVYIYESDF